MMCFKNFFKRFRHLWVVFAVITLSFPNTANADVVVNETNFPDDAFRELVATYATDGVISDDALEGIYYFQVFESVKNFKGLELLTGIRHLDIFNFDAPTLDLSTLVNLDELQLSTYGEECSLKSLDLSNNTHLEDISLYGTTSLTSLKLPASETVKRLSLTNAPKLTSLNVKACTNLSSLALDNVGITSLDLSGLEALEVIHIDDSGTSESHCQIETINLNGCSALSHFSINYNPIESIDLSGLVNLIRVTISHCNLTSFKVENFEHLTDLDVSNNALSRIEVKGCPALYNLWCSENGLKELIIDEDVSFNSLSTDNNQLIELDLSHIGDNCDALISNQTPDVVAVKLAKDQVGLAISDRFNVSNVSNTMALGMAQTAKEVTIDGIRYFVFFNDADNANDLIGSTNSYDYFTNATYYGDNINMPVTLNVTSVTKHPAFIKLASTDVVKGVYGSPAPTAPAIIRSQDYDGTLTYKSSNEKVVKVDADGKLTIVGAGSATITISGAETDYRLAPKSISYEVNIDKAKVEFAYAEAKQEMIILDKVPENQLSIGVYDGTMAYKSSNTKVATVAADGKLTIVAAGVVTITASGAETANCYEATPASYELTIKKKTSSLTLSANEINGIYGGKITAPEVTKNNGYDGTLTFVSADKKVVTVSDKGVLTIVGAGETTVTVTGPETTYYYAPAAVSYTVKVDKADVTFAYAEDKQEMVSLNQVPENKLSTGIYDGTVTYQTSDAKIATVDANGKLTVVKAAGVVTITASGAETANCNKPASASYELTIKIRGDVNGDGLLNKTDLEMVADCIMKGGNDQKCDINGDNAVNATDLVSLANLIK